jgi:predicted nuclease of predicted toxin-antitoxin system
MKLELDENFGRRCSDILSSSGHDVATVTEQHMSGASDEDVIRTCHSELRCLVTLDLDFSNPLRFRPADYSGIAVIRMSGRASYTELLSAVTTFVKALETESIAGNLGLLKSDASVYTVLKTKHR